MIAWWLLVKWSQNNWVRWGIQGPRAHGYYQSSTHFQQGGDPVWHQKNAVLSLAQISSSFLGVLVLVNNSPPTSRAPKFLNYLWPFPAADSVLSCCFSLVLPWMVLGDLLYGPGFPQTWCISSSCFILLLDCSPVSLCYLCWLITTSTWFRYHL